MQTLVVAANNNEDVTWTKQIEGWEIHCYHHFHPPGRECDTYLHYLIFDHFTDDDVVFSHGYPFDHDPEFITHLSDDSVRYYGMTETCEPNGMPRVEWCPLHEWCQVLGLPPLPNFTFVAGAQYRLTKEQLATRSLDFYKAIYYLTKIEEDRSEYEAHWCVPESRSAYVLERIWPLIWNVKL